ncbi:ty3-gypsy retrotransposon protein, partial [Tanacetum coccineum]
FQEGDMVDALSRILEQKSLEREVDNGSKRRDYALLGASLFAFLNPGPGSFAHRRIWDPGIKRVFQDNTLRTRWFRRSNDPERWIFAITEYFSLLNTPVGQRLRIVGFNLEGVAAEWFRWMSRNGLITTWDRFVESVKNRFWPSKYEDPQGALSKLLQLGTVEDYQREFEKLMNRVTGIVTPCQWRKHGMRRYRSSHKIQDHTLYNLQ